MSIDEDGNVEAPRRARVRSESTPSTSSSRRDPELSTKDKKGEDRTEEDPSDDENEELDVEFVETIDSSTGIPEWVIEAEELYVGGKLRSIRAVASRFNKSKTNVGEWAKRRGWDRRRRRNEEEAARKLEQKIDDMAIQDLVDTFSEMDMGVIKLGGAALAMYTRHLHVEQEKQKRAMADGGQYIPQALGREFMALIDKAMELRPKSHDGETVDDLAALLNPDVMLLDAEEEASDE